RRHRLLAGPIDRCSIGIDAEERNLRERFRQRPGELRAGAAAEIQHRSRLGMSDDRFDEYLPLGTSVSIFRQQSRHGLSTSSAYSFSKRAASSSAEHSRRAHSSAPAAQRPRSSSSPRILSIASPNAPASPVGTRMPVSPERTASRRPPASKA